MDEFISVMKALSDPGRVRIIKLLQGHRLCAREIQRVLGLAQPTVSSHLKILEHAGFIEKERQGSRMIFSLSDGSQSVYVEAMLVDGVVKTSIYCVVCSVAILNILHV